MLSSLWCFHGIQSCTKLSNFLFHHYINYRSLPASSCGHDSESSFSHRAYFLDLIPFNENPHNLLGLVQPPGLGSFTLRRWITSWALDEPSKYSTTGLFSFPYAQITFMRVLSHWQRNPYDLGIKTWANLFNPHELWYFKYLGFRSSNNKNPQSSWIPNSWTIEQWSRSKVHNKHQDLQLTGTLGILS